MKKWSKRQKLTAGLAALVVLAIAGVAIALLLLRAPLTGSGNIVAAPNLRYVSAEVVEQQNVSCSVAVLNGGSSADLQLENIVTGTPSKCRVKFTVKKENTNESMVVSNVKFSSVTSEAFLAACGSGISDTGTAVTVDFTTSASAQPQNFTADEPQAGISATDQASYDPTACPGS